MCHHYWINLGIGDGVSQYSEVDASSCPLLSQDHTAPFGSVDHDARGVLWSSDECEFLQRLAVDIHLGRESGEVISGALNFIAVDAAVDDGHVDAALGVGEAKLVDHERIGTRLGLSQSFGV